MAQTAEAPKPTWTFALKGFVSMSAAYQSGTFGASEGQQSLYSTTNASSTATVKDKNSLTFDVRQSRFNFSVKGPQVLGGATPSAVLEIDFFQGFGPGAYGDVSLLNRMRTAYSELDWGAGKLQLGQQNDLVFAMAPTSLSHIAFPIGYVTGNIGWRRPGVFGYYKIAAPSDLNIELAGEVGRSQWNDAAAGATCTVGGAAPAGSTCTVTGTPTIGGASGAPGGINLGEASGGPALEGRVTVSYAKLLTVWAATHWNQVDLTGYGNGANSLGTTHSIATVAYNGGIKVAVPLPNDMGLVVQGTGYTGKNLGPLVAQFLSFNLGTQDKPDVNSSGWWAQAGLNFTKELSLWGFYGMSAINKTDFVRAAYGANKPYENATTNVIAMYRDGGYGLSAEWLNFNTKYSTTVNTATNTITANHSSKSDQYMLTATYFF
jgi:hypothetical protein